MLNFHFGNSSPSTFQSMMMMIVMHTALKNQLRISKAHHSMNQRVNQLVAFSDFDTCHENRDCEASKESGIDGGMPLLEVSIEL
jgi:hypothetical protein